MDGPSVSPEGIHDETLFINRTAERTSYLATKSGVPTEIKDFLLNFSPSSLYETGGQKDVYEESLPPDRIFAEYLALSNLPDDEMLVFMKNGLPVVSQFYIKTAQLYKDLTGQGYYNPGEKETIEGACQQLQDLGEFFGRLAVAEKEEKLSFGKLLRQKFLEASLNLENDLTQMENDLYRITPERAKDKLRPIREATVFVSRAEWIFLIPKIAKIPTGEAGDGYLGIDKLKQRNAIFSNFFGMKSIPNGNGECCAFSVIDIGFEPADDGGCKIVIQTDSAKSVARHEAFRLSDKTEVTLLSPTSVSAKTGFRVDEFDLVDHKMLRTDESEPRAAIEEGLAVLFEYGFPEEINNPNVLVEYRRAAEITQIIIKEVGGIETLMEARLNHDWEPVAKVLDKAGMEKYRKELMAINQRINRAFFTELSTHS